MDQFEGLLTQTQPDQRARFAQLLQPALGSPVQVVAPLRPEFLDQLLVDPELARLPTRTHTLRPLNREALRTVIQGPAQLADIEVDDDLVARLVADTDSGEALPLLAFTLSQLAERISRGGRLSQERYDQLGGVQGALTRQADAALAEATAATGRDRKEVIAGLLRMVAVDEQDRATRWRIARNSLPEPVNRELDVFVERRLLTTDTETDTDTVVVGVAHEKILTAWSPLAQEIDKNKSALRARRAVEQAATAWNNDGRPPARLWERGQLAAALADIGVRIRAHDPMTDHVEISPTARAFLRDSIRRDRLRRRRATTVLSVLLVLALVAAGTAFTQQQIATEQRNTAMSQQVARQAMELRDTNPALAAQLSLAAYRLVPTTEARSSLLNTFADPYATRFTDHTNRVYSVAFSPDGRTLATAGREKTVRLWDTSDPQHPHLLGTFTGHNGTVGSAAFSPDGHTLATASWDGTARLWDIHDPHKPSPLGILSGHNNRVGSAIFSPDRRTLVTASTDDTARLWDIHDPRKPSQLGILTGHTQGVYAVTFSPDGHTLATASNDENENVRLWDIHNLRQPSPLSTLTGHTNAVSSVAFRPDSSMLATSSHDGTARLWDIHNLREPSPLARLTGHTREVYEVAFSRDGHTLATASLDGTARLWETNVDNVTARICHVTWPTITKNEWDQYLPGLKYRPPCLPAS